MIDILIPVLGRPQRVQPLLENIAQATSVPHRVLFLSSVGDSEEIAALEQAGAEHIPFEWPPAKGQYARKINLGYQASGHPWLLLGADDVFFHPGWDELALKAAGEDFQVVSLNDRANYFVRQGLLATHSLVRRTYIEEQGASLDGPESIYHPGYSHNFCDCELSVLARQRKVFVFERGAILEHLHPAFGRAPQDTTYEIGFKDFYADRALFCKRLGVYRDDRLVRRFNSVIQQEQMRERRRARQQARMRRR